MPVSSNSCVRKRQCVLSLLASFLVMYMAEAPGMDKILNLVVFGLLVSKMNNTVTCKGNMYVRCEK